MLGQNKYLSNFNWGLLCLMVLIIFAGLINLYSATFPREGSAQICINQIYWFIIGLAALVVVIAIDYRVLERFSYVFYGVMIVLLVLVALKGKTALGGRRWLSLGPVSIQPSELMKIAIILALAKFYNTRQDEGPYGLRQLWMPIMIAVVPAVLILRQPDLGTSIIVLAIAFSMVVFGKMRFFAFIASIGTGLGVFAVLWQFLLKGYQKKRIEAFINPDADLLGSGYHANQSMIAVGSGKGVGKGFMGSTQSQFSFLPEQHTDFIFSVFAEEWGFAGVLLMLILFFVLLGFIIEVSRTAKDKFGIFTAIGVFFMIFWHIMINVGMVSGMLPVVGVTLPFFSAGGSSLISMMIGIGIVLNISMRRYRF